MTRSGADDMNPVPAEIGLRARKIRKRRGLTQEVVAGLAGISESYLSMLESGKRRFESRSLINKIAKALDCSVVDLTAEPYEPMDQAAVQAQATVPPIALALHDCALDDVPDIGTRPLDELVAAVRTANGYRDQTDYVNAGKDLGAILTELQVVNARDSEESQISALKALVEVGIVTYELTKNLGHPEVALSAAARGYEAAIKLGDPGLIGFATWYNALAHRRVNANRRADRLLRDGISSMEALADPTAESTLCAEVYALLHLTSALHAGKDGDEARVNDHLHEAETITSRTGECNTFYQHVGPSNAALWRLSIEVELQMGAGVYERAMAANIDVAALGSANRAAAMNFDLARALAQGGTRDWEAIQHLDAADRAAPHRIRFDPVARELLDGLDNRARMKTWELGSLRNRFGMTATAP